MAKISRRPIWNKLDGEMIDGPTKTDGMPKGNTRASKQPESEDFIGIGGSSDAIPQAGPHPAWA
jgi:hypothetical protein